MKICINTMAEAGWRVTCNMEDDTIDIEPMDKDGRGQLSMDMRLAAFSTMRGWESGIKEEEVMKACDDAARAIIESLIWDELRKADRNRIK